jgi:hypothetical protein
MAQVTPPSWRVGAAGDTCDQRGHHDDATVPPCSLAFDFITTQNFDKICSNSFSFSSTHFLQKFWSRSKLPLVRFVISPSLTIDLIVAALTVQVHIIPGLISGILTCVAMSKNPVRRKFSRHIDIRRYFVRDMVAAGVLKLVPLRSHLMVADALTKRLSSPAHIKHREIMWGHVPFSFAAPSLRCAIGD